MSFLSFTFLVRGKYICKNVSARIAHVVMELGTNEFNQALALYLNVKGKSFSLKASAGTP